MHPASVPPECRLHPRLLLTIYHSTSTSKGPRASPSLPPRYRPLCPCKTPYVHNTSASTCARPQTPAVRVFVQQHLRTPDDTQGPSFMPPRRRPCPLPTHLVLDLVATDLPRVAVV